MKSPPSAFDGFELPFGRVRGNSRQASSGSPTSSRPGDSFFGSQANLIMSSASLRGPRPTRISTGDVSVAIPLTTVEVPGLIFPAEGEDSNKMSTKALASNMVLSIIGTTVLGISAQMKRGGWLLTPILLCVGCAIVSEMTVLVSVTIDILQGEGIEVSRYQDYAEGAFGPWGRKVSSVTSSFALLGMICGGMILITRNLQFAAPIESWSWPLSCTKESGCVPGQNWWALFMSATTAFYAFADVSTVFQRAAAIGPIVCVLCVAFAWAGNFKAISDLQEMPESCRTGAIDNWSLWPNIAGDSAWAATSNIASIASYGFYCFAVVVTVPTLKGQMEEPSRLVPASVSAYVLCALLFLIIMLTGYWGFGNLGPDNIIEGMRSNRPNGWWALTGPWETGTGTMVGESFAWMIVANLLLTDAIYVPCTVLALEGFCPSLFDSNQAARLTLRACLVLFRFFVTAQVRSFIDMSNLTSSLFCVCNNILLPILAFYKTRASARLEVGPLRRGMHGIIFLFGCWVVVFGASGAAMNMFWKTKDSPGSCFIEDIRYVSDMGSYTLSPQNSNATACQQLCANKHGCKHFSLVPDNSRCYLHHDCFTEVPSVGAISGPSTCVGGVGAYPRAGISSQCKSEFQKVCTSSGPGFDSDNVSVVVNYIV